MVGQLEREVTVGSVFKPARFRPQEGDSVGKSVNNLGGEGKEAAEDLHQDHRRKEDLVLRLLLGVQQLRPLKVEDYLQCLLGHHRVGQPAQQDPAEQLPFVGVEGVRLQRFLRRPVIMSAVELVNGQEQAVQIPDQLPFQLGNRRRVPPLGDTDDQFRIIAQDVLQPLGVDAVRIDLAGNGFRLHGDDEAYVLALGHRQRRTPVGKDLPCPERLGLETEQVRPPLK